MNTANVGQSTWTFTPLPDGRFRGDEQGLGYATGTATVTGTSFSLDWSTTGGYSGFYTGRTGTERTTWTRVGGASTAAAPPIMDRYRALAGRLTGEARGRFYADSAVMMARYGRSIGWTNGGDPNAPAGDPNRGLDNWDAHYGHGAGGGEIAIYVEQRLTALRAGLSPADYARMEAELSALLTNHGG
jgi:hypothetical protein